MRLAPDGLSERRRRILDGIAEGKSNPVLAEELGLTLDGVKWHVSEMLGELGLASRQQLAEWWREERRKQAPVAGPLGRLREALRWGTRVALAGVITGAIVFGIWCAASRNDAAAPPEREPGPSALAYVTFDPPAQDGDIAHGVSHLYIEEPGQEPRLVKDYPGQLMYEMLASPDGRYIAVTTGEMVILARDGSEVMNLGAAAVSFSGAGPFASWSPDGSKFAFSRANISLQGLSTATADLATPPRAVDPSKPETWIEIVDVGQRKVITPEAISHASLSLPSWAPDGKQFAALLRGDAEAASDGELVVVDAASGDTRPLTSAFGVPLWSPDGSSIAAWFGSNVPILDNGVRRVLRAALGIVPAGGGEPDHFYEAWFLSGQAWSPDGRRLAAACIDSSRGTAQPTVTHLCLIPADGERDPEMIPGVDDISYASFSPDGKSIAYLAGGTGDGRAELRVVDLSTRQVRTVASGVPIGGFSWLGAGTGATARTTVAAATAAARIEPATIAPVPSPDIVTSLASPTATAQSQPFPPERLGDALIDASDIEGGAREWAQEDTGGDRAWDNGLCGKEVGPAPVAQFTRRFVGNPAGIYSGWLVESILVFAPGDATKFMAALDASAGGCDTELRASGHALFRPQLPRIRHQSQAFTVESFSCCATPRADEDHLPHDIVYIRGGDVVLHLYASIDVVEAAARAAEDRLDAVLSAGN